jgi:hypothetical protein
MSKDSEIYRASSKFDLEFSRSVIHDSCCREWHVSFCVLSNPVEHLPFTTLIDGDMLSSLCGLVQPVREGRWDTES